MNQPVTKPEDEPSMEEILASIRKIISDDDVKEAEDTIKTAGVTSSIAQENTTPVSAYTQPVTQVNETQTSTAPTYDLQDDDVLELTEMVDEAGNPITEDVQEATQEEPVEIMETTTVPDFQEVVEEEEIISEPEPIMDIQEDVSEISEAEIEEVPAQEIFNTMEMEEDYEEEPSEPLISEPSLHEAAAALGALSRVASQASRPKEPQMEGMPSQKTTEELVKDILKPLLKEWLDANLPSLVKWIVAEQVEKIVQQAAGYTAEEKEDESA